jgi:hypothetical protein
VPKTSGTTWTYAMLSGLLFAGSASAQQRAVHFDGADAPPAATAFEVAGARWSGGKVETEGVPGLFGAGSFHYEVQPGGAQVAFEPPARELRFFFVHGFGVVPGSARAYDAAGALLGSADSRKATTLGASDAFVSFDTTMPIARVAFDGGAVDSVSWKTQTQAAGALQLGTQINGSWLNTSPVPYLGGQGLMLEYLPETQRVFVAWFTYGGGTEPAQRWLVAEGPSTVDGAELQLFDTRGGRFNEASAVQQTPIGTLRLRFTACDTATAEFAIPGEQRSGSFQIRRARSLLTGFSCG